MLPKRLAVDRPEVTTRGWALGGGPAEQLEGRSSWELINLPLDATFALREAFETLCRHRDDGAALRERVAAARFERLLAPT